MYLTEEQTLALQLRRRSFKLALADQRVQGALIAYSNAERPLFEVCPCCGYPTIAARGWYDTCPICMWEDDRQDDPEADEVWGGPNYRYSLSEARRNFIYARTKFRRDDEHFERELRVAPQREALIRAYDALLPDVFPWSFIAAMRRLDALKEQLYEARYGKAPRRRWRREYDEERRLADRVHEIWETLARGWVPSLDALRSPSLEDHDRTVFFALAQRIDAVVQQRLGEAAPVLIRRRPASLTWTRGERSAYISRYSFPDVLTLGFEPYDGRFPEPSFRFDDAATPNAAAEAIVAHFTAEPVDAAQNARQ